MINVVKTSAQSLGPLITGILAEHRLFWVAFVAAGSLKACYDLGMLVVFASHRPREDEVSGWDEGDREEFEAQERLRESEDPEER